MMMARYDTRNRHGHTPNIILSFLKSQLSSQNLLGEPCTKVEAGLAALGWTTDSTYSYTGAPKLLLNSLNSTYCKERNHSLVTCTLHDRARPDMVVSTPVQAPSPVGSFRGR